MKAAKSRSPASAAATQLDLFQDALPVITPRSTKETGATPDANPLLVGCAGWNLSGPIQAHLPPECSDRRSHLERYAALFPAVEINTSFYRPHMPATYARWRDSVPEGFRFSVKMPRTITHENRLDNATRLLDRFLDEAGHLGDKLRCLLVQLPPSLEFDPFVAEVFFDQLRLRTGVPVACEPRHGSWFKDAAAQLLEYHQICYVQADPPVSGHPVPSLRSSTVYLRLHGAPVIYRSAYSDRFLDDTASVLTKAHRDNKEVWCIFDNTAEGAAVTNALALREKCRFLQR